MEPSQSAKDFHDSAAMLFDIAAGVAGTTFLALTIWGWFLGEIVVNGERVRYPDPPFLWAIGLGAAIGLGCWSYSGIRFWLRTRMTEGPRS